MTRFNFTEVAQLQVKKRQLSVALGLYQPITVDKAMTSGYNVSQGKAIITGVDAQTKNTDLIRTDTLLQTYGSRVLGNDNASIL